MRDSNRHRSCRARVVAALAMVLAVSPAYAQSEATSDATASSEKAGPPPAPARYIPIELGVRMALSLSQFAILPGVEQNPRTFASLGLVTRFKIVDGHEVQTGISWERKGTVFVNEPPEEDNVQTADYLVVPVAYRAKASPMLRLEPYLLLGGYVGVLVGGDLEEFFSRIDYGATVGAGANIHVTRSLIADVQIVYSQGIPNVNLQQQFTRVTRSLLIGVAFAWDLGGDGDRDGLLNRKETLAGWESPEDWDGFADDDGIADPNNDGDQFDDKYDPCPDRAEDVDGHEDMDGCPDVDDDDDGVFDNQVVVSTKEVKVLDMCRTKPFWGYLEPPIDDTDLARLAQVEGADSNGLGCFPEYTKFFLRPRSNQLHFKPEDTITFDLGKSVVTDPARIANRKKILDEVAAFLRNHPWVSLTIRGHSSIGEKPSFDVDRAKKTHADLLKRARNPEEKANWTSRLKWEPVGTYIPAIEDCKVRDERTKPTLSDELAAKLARLQALNDAKNDPYSPDKAAAQIQYRKQKSKLEDDEDYKRYIRQQEQYRLYQVDMKLQKQCADTKTANRRVTFHLRY